MPCQQSLKELLHLESSLLTFNENIIRRGLDRGVFVTQDPFIVTNIIQYLLMIAPLTGCNMKREHKFDDFAGSIINFVLKALGSNREFRTLNTKT